MWIIDRPFLLLLFFLFTSLPLLTLSALERTIWGILLNGVSVLIQQMNKMYESLKKFGLDIKLSLSGILFVVSIQLSRDEDLQYST